MVELDSRWGEETIAVWTFLEAAYRKGVLDEVFRLANTFMDPAINPMDVMGDMEERLSTFDFGPLDETFREQLVPIMKTLSDEDVLEGLVILLQMVRSLSELALAGMGGDVGEAARRARLVGKSIKTVGLVLSPYFLQKTLPMIQLLLAAAGEEQQQ